MSLKPHDRKYLSFKTANACTFSTVNRKQKLLSAASRNTKFWTQPQTVNSIHDPLLLTVEKMS